MKKNQIAVIQCDSMDSDQLQSIQRSILERQGPTLGQVYSPKIQKSFVSFTSVDFIRTLPDRTGKQVKYIGNSQQSPLRAYYYLLLHIDLQQRRYYPHLRSIIKQQLNKDYILRRQLQDQQLLKNSKEKKINPFYLNKARKDSRDKVCDMYFQIVHSYHKIQDFIMRNPKFDGNCMNMLFDLLSNKAKLLPILEMENSNEQLQSKGGDKDKDRDRENTSKNNSMKKSDTIQKISDKVSKQSKKSTKSTKSTTRNLSEQYKFLCKAIKQQKNGYNVYRIGASKKFFVIIQSGHVFVALIGLLLNNSGRKNSNHQSQLLSNASTPLLPQVIQLSQQSTPKFIQGHQSSIRYRKKSHKNSFGGDVQIISYKDLNNSLHQLKNSRDKRQIQRFIVQKSKIKPQKVLSERFQTQQMGQLQQVGQQQDSNNKKTSKKQYQMQKEQSQKSVKAYPKKNMIQTKTMRKSHCDTVFVSFQSFLQERERGKHIQQRQKQKLGKKIDDSKISLTQSRKKRMSSSACLQAQQAQKLALFNNKISFSKHDRLKFDHIDKQPPQRQASHYDSLFNQSNGLSQGIAQLKNHLLYNQNRPDSPQNQQNKNKKNMQLMVRKLKKNIIDSKIQQLPQQQFDRSRGSASDTNHQFIKEGLTSQALIQMLQPSVRQKLQNRKFSYVSQGKFHKNDINSRDMNKSDKKNTSQDIIWQRIQIQKEKLQNRNINKTHQAINTKQRFQENPFTMSDLDRSNSSIPNPPLGFNNHMKSLKDLLQQKERLKLISNTIQYKYIQYNQPQPAGWIRKQVIYFFGDKAPQKRILLPVRKNINNHRNLAKSTDDKNNHKNSNQIIKDENKNIQKQKNKIKPYLYNQSSQFDYNPSENNRYFNLMLMKKSNNEYSYTYTKNRYFSNFRTNEIGKQRETDRDKYQDKDRYQYKDKDTLIQIRSTGSNNNITQNPLMNIAKKVLSPPQQQQYHYMNSTNNYGRQYENKNNKIQKQQQQVQHEYSNIKNNFYYNPSLQVQQYIINDQSYYTNNTNISNISNISNNNNIYNQNNQNNRKDSVNLSVYSRKATYNQKLYTNPGHKNNQNNNQQKQKSPSTTNKKIHHNINKKIKKQRKYTISSNNYNINQIIKQSANEDINTPQTNSPNYNHYSNKGLIMSNSKGNLSYGQQDLQQDYYHQEQDMIIDSGRNYIKNNQINNHSQYHHRYYNTNHSNLINIHNGNIHNGNIHGNNTNITSSSSKGTLNIISSNNNIKHSKTGSPKQKLNTNYRRNTTQLKISTTFKNQMLQLQNNYLNFNTNTHLKKQQSKSRSGLSIDSSLNTINAINNNNNIISSINAHANTNTNENINRQSANPIYQMMSNKFKQLANLPLLKLSPKKKQFYQQKYNLNNNNNRNISQNNIVSSYTNYSNNNTNLDANQNTVKNYIQQKQKQKQKQRQRHNSYYYPTNNLNTNINANGNTNTNTNTNINTNINTNTNSNANTNANTNNINNNFAIKSSIVGGLPPTANENTQNNNHNSKSKSQSQKSSSPQGNLSINNYSVSIKQNSIIIKNNSKEKSQEKDGKKVIKSVNYSTSLQQLAMPMNANINGIGTGAVNSPKYQMSLKQMLEIQNQKNVNNSFSYQTNNTPYTNISTSMLKNKNTSNNNINNNINNNSIMSINNPQSKMITLKQISSPSNYNKNQNKYQTISNYQSRAHRGSINIIIPSNTPKTITNNNIIQNFQSQLSSNNIINRQKQSLNVQARRISPQSIVNNTQNVSSNANLQVRPPSNANTVSSRSNTYTNSNYNYNTRRL